MINKKAEAPQMSGQRTTLNYVLSWSSLALLVLVSFTSFCQAPMRLVDTLATRETQALFYNLAKLSKKHILFGHQHATEYGHGWRNEKDRSDVKSVVGSHPAVIGVDFSGLSGRPDEQIEKEKKLLRENIAATYDRGGVTTVAWHFINPVSGGGFYWKDSVSLPAVRYLIPGGQAHEKYKSILTTIGGFVKSVKGKDGTLAPMIFRPFHEFDGDWFWWGRSHSTVEEFTTLWKFTVGYLRDSLQVHNLVYAFSPDCLFTTEAQFLERYPGNQWVDMVGMDNYADFGRYGRYTVDSGILKLKIVADFARKAGKLAAFTETGLESVKDSSWYTSTLLKALKKEKLRLAYVLVWRNDVTSPSHYYAPFPGHPGVEDFRKFYNNKYTLFENDLENIYHLKDKYLNKTF
ncbi:MAG: glycosyl hydrolase [Bacteroidota bacterium]